MKRKGLDRKIGYREERSLAFYSLHLHLKNLSKEMMDRTMEKRKLHNEKGYDKQKYFFFISNVQRNIRPSKIFGK